MGLESNVSADVTDWVLQCDGFGDKKMNMERYIGRGPIGASTAHGPTSKTHFCLGTSNR